ncbi:MAG: hypothetical protein PVF45_15150 [Anaerolineae bacterium]|jgi:hypothetical protein
MRQRVLTCVECGCQDTDGHFTNGKCPDCGADVGPRPLQKWIRLDDLSDARRKGWQSVVLEGVRA